MTDHRLLPRRRNRNSISHTLFVLLRGVRPSVLDKMRPRSNPHTIVMALIYLMCTTSSKSSRMWCTTPFSCAHLYSGGPRQRDCMYHQVRPQGKAGFLLL